MRAQQHTTPKTQFVFKPTPLPTPKERIKKIKQDLAIQVEEIDAEIFYTMQQLIDRELTPLDASTKVQMLRDDIKCIKETARLSIEKLKGTKGG